MTKEEYKKFQEILKMLSNSNRATLLAVKEFIDETLKS